MIEYILLILTLYAQVFGGIVIAGLIAWAFTLTFLRHQAMAWYHGMSDLAPTKTTLLEATIVMILVIATIGLLWPYFICWMLARAFGHGKEE